MFVYLEASKTSQPRPFMVEATAASGLATELTANYIKKTGEGERY